MQDKRFVLISEGEFDSRAYTPDEFSIEDVKIERHSKICKAPVETGVGVADHIVRDPAMATLIVSVANHSEAYLSAHLAMLKERGVRFSLFTPDDYAKDLAIESALSSYKTDRYDRTSVKIVLQEILIATTAVANKGTVSIADDDAPEVASGYSAPEESE